MKTVSLTNLRRILPLKTLNRTLTLWIFKRNKNHKDDSITEDPKEDSISENLKEDPFTENPKENSIIDDPKENPIIVTPQIHQDSQ